MNKQNILKALTSNQSSRKGARISTTKVYELGTDVNMEWAPPPQALKLLEIMYGEERESWTEQGLHDVLSEHTEISEKQAPWSIFKYYRKQLIDNGFLTVA